MSKQTEALRLALEALEEIADEVFSPYDNKLGAAILAIREALAEQPAQQQEPVIDKSAAIRIATALGWAPRKPWAGLTDGQLNDLYATHHDKFGQPTSAEQNGWGYERAIEAKLREKNA